MAKPPLPSVLTRKVFIIESRFRDESFRGGFSAWEDISPDLRYTLDSVIEFQAGLDYDDCFGAFPTQWRARMLPEFGYDVRPLTWQRRVAEPRAPMSARLCREMPSYVHRVNDVTLASLGG